MRVLVFCLLSVPAVAAPANRCRAETTPDLPSKALIELSLACAQKSGDAKEAARQKLPDGRTAIWIVLHQEPSAPADIQSGLLAIVRHDGKAAIIDSVGAWENGADAKHALKPGQIEGGKFFLEPTGHSGTGGGTDSTGMAVWLDKKGKLSRAGELDVDGFDENMGTDGPHWLVEYKGSISVEDSIHVTEKQTWTLKGSKRKEVLKRVIERFFEIEQDKLKADQPAERTPPHPADAPSKHVTVSADASGGTLKLSFETAAISEEVVKQVADLAPEATPDSSTVAPSLEECDKSADYKDCGSRDINAPHFFENADVNLRRGRAQIDSIGNRRVPPELELATQWLRQMLMFSVAMQEHRLKFLKSGKLDELKGGYYELQTEKVCAPVLAKLAAEKDPTTRYRLASFEWHNCVNNAWRTLKGDYPKAYWKTFLESYGIKSKFIGQEGD
jgi:hypothetical protein